MSIMKNKKSVYEWRIQILDLNQIRKDHSTVNSWGNFTSLFDIWEYPSLKFDDSHEASKEFDSIKTKSKNITPFGEAERYSVALFEVTGTYFSICDAFYVNDKPCFNRGYEALKLDNAPSEQD